MREALTFHDADHPYGLSVRVDEVYVDTTAGERHADLLELAAGRGVRVIWCDSKAIASLTDAVTPQGIAARCRFLDVPLAGLLAPSPSSSDVESPSSSRSSSDVESPSSSRSSSERGTSDVETRQADGVRNQGPRLLAVPVDVRDPGNLGTIIRCADASGADGVVILGDSVDAYNPKAVRSSAGSLFHLPLALDPDPAGAIMAMKDAGLQIIATEGEASMDLDDVIDEGRLAAPTAWLFGNEAHGLPDEIAALADIRLRIPIHGLAESLNLSTAAAICLYASARAQREQ